jgi:SAM-dependent methyltransferase
MMTAKPVELSGDVRLSASDRLRYLLQNAFRNIRTLGRGPRAERFAPSWDQCRPYFVGQSPGRLVTEFLIETELPKLFPPQPVAVLEIGCGSGSMASRLAKLGYSGDYTGVDVQDRFQREAPTGFPFVKEFSVIDAHAFVPSRQVDLLLSVSALEHIANDSELIARFPSFMRPNGLEFHVVPSGPSLAVYLLHGFRQYTPKKLSDRFGAGQVRIVRIGGIGSFLLHACSITIPENLLGFSLRKTMPGGYRSLIRFALRADQALPYFPTAYAVIRRKLGKRLRPD